MTLSILLFPVVNCTGGMSEECGQVPEQKCSLQDQEQINTNIDLN